MWQVITIVWVTNVQKDFQIRILIMQFLTKYQIFKKLPQISHIHKNVIFKIGIFFWPAASSLYKCCSKDMQGKYFFHFCQL